MIYQRSLIDTCKKNPEWKQLYNECVAFWMDQILKDGELTEFIEKTELTDDWWIKNHFFFGMGIRNYMRMNGFTDKKFGLNLDEIYVALFMDAVERLW
jgi:hypothetical protein